MLATRGNRKLFRSDLHQSQTRSQRRFDALLYVMKFAFVKIGNPVNQRQTQGAQHGTVRREQRTNSEAVKMLPGKKLSFATLDFSRPSSHPVKEQSDICMGIVELLGYPGKTVLHENAEFFMQFAYQRRLGRLPRFNLAAGKFPIAFINFPGWTLREKKTAIIALDHGRDDGDTRPDHNT